ncbi:MAG: hypothetical protein MOB07_28070 [Acidobacteria bacterium]|nr:hypothetical protein [Acidobacteriota bacterium]
MATKQKPDQFLIIKEPPFPDSYSKMVYINRIISELAPQYVEVKHEFIVRELPTTPDELKTLIHRLSPDAYFDKTIITQFHDTDGGKGILVWIYEAVSTGQTIEVEADSIEEARKKAKSQIPRGFHLDSEKIISDGAAKSLTFTAQTIEEAFAKAQNEIPPGLDILEKRVLAAPERRVITIMEFDEQAARIEAEKQISATATVESLKLTATGRKGFLGIGKTPNQYECAVFQQAAVLVICKGKAKLLAKIAEGEAKKVVKPDYPSWMTRDTRIPPEARQFQVDEDCELIPVDEFNCPVCGESLGSNLPSRGPNVIVHFRLDWGAYFWWSVVPHCGKKLLISNRRM